MCTWSKGRSTKAKSVDRALSGILGVTKRDVRLPNMYPESYDCGLPGHLAVMRAAMMEPGVHTMSDGLILQISCNIFLAFKWILIFVCFITKSFLTYSFVLPTPTLSTICRPLSSYMCSITPETVNVGSSYSHMRGTGVGCWLSDRSNCSHWSFEAAVLPINPNIYTDQWEPIIIYHSITLSGRYTTMQPTLLTSWLQLLSYNV